LKLAKLPQSENKQPRPSSRAAEAENKGGKYFKPLREEAKRQIRRLIIEEGYTPTEAMYELNIPRRTFQRYLNEAFLPERQVLARRLTDDEVLNQLAILESRLTKSRRDIINLTKDPTIDSKRLTAIVAAYNLSEEIAATIFKIHSQTAPDVLVDRHKQFFKDREELALNKRGKLIEKEEENVVEYDELDYEEEDDEDQEEEKEDDDNNYEGQERRES
jgi:hypothetical protein